MNPMAHQPAKSPFSMLLTLQNSLELEKYDLGEIF